MAGKTMKAAPKKAPKAKATSKKVKQEKTAKKPVAVNVEKPARRRLAAKKYACDVPECRISAQSCVEEADQFGPAGNRCSGHNGGTRCNVVGCTNSAFRKVKEDDTHGEPGLRCVRHGGRNGMCNVASCPNVAKYHSVADHFGAKGKRCKRHCVKALCEEEGCGRLGRDSNSKPRRCVRHGGGFRCQETGCMASALPKRGPNAPRKCSKHGGGVYCAFEACKNLALMDFDGHSNSNAKCRKHALQARNGGVPVKIVSKRKREVNAKSTPKAAKLKTSRAKVQKENIDNALEPNKSVMTFEFPSKSSDEENTANAFDPKVSPVARVLAENQSLQSAETLTVDTY